MPRDGVSDTAGAKIYIDDSLENPIELINILNFIFLSKQSTIKAAENRGERSISSIRWRR